MFNLTGKRALVTGSTQGIGYAIAKCLAAQGAEVIIHGATSYDKCVNAAEKIFRELGGAKLGVIVADLSKPDGAEALYNAVGDVDILVLNASIQYRKKWNEITPEEMETQLQTNFKSSLRLIQLCEPHMEKNAWGRIVTVGSVQQYKPHKDMAVYASSKAANLSSPRASARRTGPRPETVISTPMPWCPGSAWSLVTLTSAVWPTNWSRNSCLEALAPSPAVSVILMMETPVHLPSLSTPTIMVMAPPKPEGTTSTTKPLSSAWWMVLTISPSLR